MMLVVLRGNIHTFALHWAGLQFSGSSRHVEYLKVFPAYHGCTSVQHRMLQHRVRRAATLRDCETFAYVHFTFLLS